MKVIAKAALIVGAVAAIATGVGAIVGGTAFLAATGVSLATVSAIGTVAGLVGSVAQALIKPKSPSVSGSLTDFKLDPAATIPIMFGRTYNGGNVVHRDSWGTDNQYQGFIVVYSGCGPITSIEGFYADRSLVQFDGGGAAIGAAFGPGGKGPWMWFRSQLGQVPEPAALMPPVAGMPGWTAAHKLSSYAAGALVLKFDKDGKKYQGGVPKTGIVGQGVRAWDPRLDSTYPGGAGPCRLDDPTTWPGTKNPWLLALQFAIGWVEAGYLVGGVGARAEAVIVSDYVAAANVADANGWTTSGVRATGDPKWETLKLLCEAGGGEPVWLGACLSCMVSTPRVSVATLTAADWRGPISVVGTQTRRGGRVNTGIPVYRSEAHGWEMIPAAAIGVPTYVVEDRGARTKEVTFQLVDQLDQAAQLTAYSLVNGREFGPIEVKLDPRWIGLQPGMAVDIDDPDAGLFDQQCIVVARNIEPATGMVSITLKSETAAKHAFALGASSIAPPTPSLGAPDYSTAAVNYETAGQAAVYIRNSAARGVDLSAVEDTVDTAAGYRGVVAPGAGNNGGAAGTIYFRDAVAGDRVYVNGLRVTKQAGASTFTLQAWKQVAGTWTKQREQAVGNSAAGGTQDIDVSAAAGFYVEPGEVLAVRIGTTGIQYTALGGGGTAWTSFTYADAPFADFDGNYPVGGGVEWEVHVGLFKKASSGTATAAISAHVRDYPDRDLGIPAATIGGLPLNQSAVLVYYDDQGRNDLTPDYQWTLDYEVAVNSTNNPYRHYVGLVPTPAVGGGPTTGDPPPYPGGGGYCVQEDTLVLVYVPGEGDREIRATDVRPGMLVRTWREDDLANGVWPVSAVEVMPCFNAWRYEGPEGFLVGSAAHRVWIGDGWRRLDEVGAQAEACNVVAISVPGARTYMSNGMLSHNIKMNQEVDQV